MRPTALSGRCKFQPGMKARKFGFRGGCAGKSAHIVRHARQPGCHVFAHLHRYIANLGQIDRAGAHICLCRSKAEPFEHRPDRPQPRGICRRNPRLDRICPLPPSPDREIQILGRTGRGRRTRRSGSRSPRRWFRHRHRAPARKRRYCALPNRPAGHPEAPADP